MAARGNRINDGAIDSHEGGNEEATMDNIATTSSNDDRLIESAV